MIYFKNAEYDLQLVFTQ